MNKTYADLIQMSHKAMRKHKKATCSPSPHLTSSTFQCLAERRGASLSHYMISYIEQPLSMSSENLNKIINPFEPTDVGRNATHPSITQPTSTKTTTSLMQCENDDVSRSNSSTGSRGVPVQNKVIDRLNVIEEEEETQEHLHFQHDDMTHQVESLLQFMDQYQTFSPLLKNSSIGHCRRPQTHDEIQSDQYDKVLSAATNDTTIMKSTNDAYDENRNDSSFAHQSIVVSSSSSSSSSSSKSRHELDLDDVKDGTHHRKTVDRSLQLITDQNELHQRPVPSSSASPSIATEREKLRVWVTQVRQAVYDWVQEYRQYMMTVQQQQEQELRPLTHDDGDPPKPQRPYRYDSDTQSIVEKYEQTIISLNEIIKEQRGRIHELEVNVRSDGKLVEGTRRDGMLRETPISTSSTSPQVQEEIEASGAMSSVDTYHNTLSRLRDEYLNGTTTTGDHATRTKEELAKAEASHKTASTTTQATSTAMIMKTKNCKRIVYSNGTVHEIYYDDDSDTKRMDVTNDEVRTKQRKQQRRRLYDIIRYYNGDIKMTTATASTKSQRKSNDDDMDEVDETYYYYSKSGVIQIARNCNSHGRDRSSPSTPTATNVNRRYRINHSPTSTMRMEYHYPNGQIEYHFGTERVVQFPDGRVLSEMLS